MVHNTEMEVDKMNDILKGMFIVLIILYVLSPIDLMPGPIDDVIVILLGVAATKTNTINE